MPVIATASSKGGAGKSTLTLVLAQALDSMGATVTIVDADPNRPLVRWRSGTSSSKVQVVGDVTESSIMKVIHEHSAARQFVLVDIEGTANRLVSRAITQADLVLIPLQASAPHMRETLQEGRWGPGTDSAAAEHASVQTTESYLGTEQQLVQAVNDGLGLDLEL